MKRTLGFWVMSLVLALGSATAGQETTPPAAPPGGGELWRKAEQSAVLILAGDRAGRVAGASAGVVVRADGILLTPYRPIKDAQAVQVRLHDGEIYDQVDLVAFDERRDVAALHIPAGGLHALANRALGDLVPGEKIYVLGPDGGMTWRFSEGVMGSVRLADELLGAGQGFRVIQFMASLPAGTLGGAVLDSKGELLGILPGSLAAGGPQYAVPVASVMGLSAQGSRRALGVGKNLELPKAIPNQDSAPVDTTNPMALLARARSLHVTSRTSFFTPFMLEHELMSNAEFRALGLNVLDENKGGDLAVKVDRPLLTYDFTYTVTDAHKGTILASGKVTAIDGPHAAQGIAKKLVQEIEKARTVEDAALARGQK